jgi:hypothetical protein
MATPCITKDDSEVEKAFWNEAKARLAVGVEPEQIINQIAKKHDLGTDVVGSILTKNKQLFQLTNEAWAKRARLSELQASARRAVADANTPAWIKPVRFVYNLPRQALTIYHGGVIPFTHGRTSMAVPGEARIFRDTVGRAYSYLTPNAGRARWAADMAVMRSDPKFNFAARVGLDIKLQSQPVGMGMSRWTRQSFDALKPMRLELFKKYWSKLPDKSFESAQALAKGINHATGVVNTSPIVSKIAGVGMFAPKLRFAKYASAVDAFTSTFGAKRFAKVAAVNLGLLGINYMFNKYVLQSNDNVNWSDPARADWMRMKIAGMTVPMSPLLETMRLPIAAGAVALNPMEDNKAKVLTKELASAVHPGINAIYGGLTGTDLATGKALPFKGASQYIYGEHRDQKKMFGKLVKNKYAQQISGGEYASGYLPIPAQPVVKELIKNGISPEMSKSFVEAILSGLVGTHAYPNVPYKKNP